eukprot:210451_1
MATPFKRIDDALAQHYAKCNRNDYFDENGIGKFIRFVKKHAFDEDAIDLELGDDPNDCLFIEMDVMFPLSMSTPPNEITRYHSDMEILKILQHCFTHGASIDIGTAAIDIGSGTNDEASIDIGSGTNEDVASPNDDQSTAKIVPVDPPLLNSIHRLLGISPRQSHDNAFVLTWQ